MPIFRYEIKLVHYKLLLEKDYLAYISAWLHKVHCSKFTLKFQNKGFDFRH